MGCGCGPFLPCAGEVYDENWEECVHCGYRRPRDTPDEDGQDFDDKQPTYYALSSAISFALETENGIDFLRLWNDGDFPEIRKRWPDHPVECLQVS